LIGPDYTGASTPLGARRVAAERAFLRPLRGNASTPATALPTLLGNARSRTGRDTILGLRACSLSSAPRRGFSDLRAHGGSVSRARIEKRWGPGPTTDATATDPGKPYLTTRSSGQIQEPR